MEAGEVQDRVIAIAEIGGDRPIDGHGEAAFDRRRAIGIGGVDPLGAPVGGPLDQLQRRFADLGQARVKQLPVPPEHEVEAGVGAHPTNVDLTRQSGEILSGDFGARPGRAQRPVKPVTDAPGDPQRSGWRRRRQPAWALRAAHRRPPGDEIDRLGRTGRGHHHAGARTVGKRRNRQRLPLGLFVARQVRGARDRGPGDAAAQQASAPAAFHPGSAKAGVGGHAVGRRPNVRECPVCINTGRRWPNQG